MIKSDLIFICTGAEKKLIQQLIDSIGGNTAGLRVFLMIVKQETRFNFISNDPLLEVQTLSVEKRMSLSAARNLALRFIFEQEVKASHIMFPDDDSSFKADFFEEYHHLNEDQPYLAKICNVEDGGDYRAYPNEKRYGTNDLLPFVASVSLVLPYKLVKQVGLFDPKLGVGAKWGSSEDLDYYLRCCKYQEFCFLPELKTYHPSRFGKYRSMQGSAIRKRFKAYTDGYLAVHYRYNLEDRLKAFALRALGGGLLSLAKLKPALAQQYFWLYFYRLKAKAYYEKLRTQQPEKLALNHEV